MEMRGLIKKKSLWQSVFLVLLLFPASASANPIGIDETIIFPFMLEAFFLAVALKSFGFRSFLVFPVWFVVTAVTWLSFIGFPLGSQILALGKNVAADGAPSLLFFTVMAIIAELLICLVEAGIILQAGRFRLVRSSLLATVEPEFSILFKLTMLGNIVSLIAGISMSLEAPAGWLLCLVIFPLLRFAGYLISKHQQIPE